MPYFFLYSRIFNKYLIFFGHFFLANLLDSSYRQVSQQTPGPGPPRNNQLLHKGSDRIGNCRCSFHAFFSKWSDCFLN